MFSIFPCTWFFGGKIRNSWPTAKTCQNTSSVPPPAPRRVDLEGFSAQFSQRCGRLREAPAADPSLVSSARHGRCVDPWDMIRGLDWRLCMESKVDVDCWWLRKLLEPLTSTLYFLERWWARNQQMVRRLMKSHAIHQKTELISTRKRSFLSFCQESIWARAWMTPTGLL